MDELKTDRNLVTNKCINGPFEQEETNYRQDNDTALLVHRIQLLVALLFSSDICPNCNELSCCSGDWLHCRREEN